MLRRRRSRMALLAGAAATMVGVGTASLSATMTASADGGPGAGPATATPIKHLVVIFQENVSFDHYFGTYPNAANTSGRPFQAAPGTPTVNGLSQPLLTNNPNAANPQRLGPDMALTCDQNHGYSAEQKAFDNGLMDKFIENTGVESCGPPDKTAPNLVMDYYDGNTVTGLWNYAQHFAMSDNSYGTTFGPSTPGAINVTSGNTHGAVCGPTSAVYGSTPCAGLTSTTLPPPTPGTSQAQGPGTVYSDADPSYDVCSYTQDGRTAANTITMGGQNIGDLLDKSGVSWGWFQGGFSNPGYVPGQPSTFNQSQVCTGTSQNIGGATVSDYSPHHNPFEYYQSTANPDHLPPTSVAAIGHQDQANHNYDLKDFWAAAGSNNLPAVSYLKAPEVGDGHAGYSDPLDEQKFLVDTINQLQKLPSWKSTAVVINYDDSDGWYDHQMGPILDQSQTPLDALSGPSTCGTTTAKVYQGQQARCGFGPRLPMMVISPWSKTNFVDNTLSSQTSVVSFIEDNWLNSQRLTGGSADAWAGTIANMFDFSHPSDGQLLLDPTTGQPQGDNGQHRGDGGDRPGPQGGQGR
jgi:phospholipase C